MPPPCILLLVAFVFFMDRLPAARAAEPFFKKGDVIAIVGGEDMVALSEYGYLELLLTRALPDYHLRFRNLAWEGDTVFEQRRELNFPAWEEQLEKIGATVVLCQFGQMESLAASGIRASGRVGVPPAGEGVPPSQPSAAVVPARPYAGDAAQDRSGRMPEPAGGTPTLPDLPEFIAAYEKLIARFSDGGKRRVAIVTPIIFPELPRPVARISNERLPHRRIPDAAANQQQRTLLANSFPYSQAITDLAARLNLPTATLMSDLDKKTAVLTRPRLRTSFLRDGIHLSELGQRNIAYPLAVAFAPKVRDFVSGFEADWDRADNPEPHQLRDLIRAKNRLWFDYWRVQNWAFLAGDRTNQPSSRDHLDPQKRWFPEERERFLPLIEAREKEIDTLAAKLSTP